MEYSFLVIFYCFYYFLDLFDASKYCSLDSPANAIMDNVPSSDLLSATELAVMSVSTQDDDQQEEGEEEQLQYGYVQANEMKMFNKSSSHMSNTSNNNFPVQQQSHGHQQQNPIYLHSFPLPRKICSNCGSISTPSWRRCPEGRNLLCNACGLYQKLHRRPRPLRIREDGSVQVIRNLHASQLGTNNGNGNASKCEHCGATESVSWCSDGRGRLLCAACSIPDDLIERIFPSQK